MTRLRLRAIVGVFAVATAAALAACGGGSSSSVTTHSAGPSQQGSSRVDGLVTVHNFTYRSFDGSRVPALLAVPRGVAIRGCLIWQYGLGSTKEESANVWQGAAGLGLATFSIDLRDHGQRASSPEVLVRAVQNPYTIAAIVRGTVGDLKRGIDYLEAQPYCHNNVSYAGISLGGIIGTILAATDHRVRAAVIMSTPATFRSLLRSGIILSQLEHKPAQLAAALKVIAPLDPDRYIGQIPAGRLMILSGRQDPIVPLASAIALQTAARNPKTVIDYAGGHDPTNGPAAPSNEQAIGSFLLTHIVEPSYGISAAGNGTYSQMAIN